MKKITAKLCTRRYDIDSNKTVYEKRLIEGYSYSKGGVDLIIHKEGRFWNITEIVTGSKFGNPQGITTRKKAIKYADNVFHDVGIERIVELRSTVKAYIDNAMNTTA